MVFRIVFSKELADNLVSVSRLADGGMTIVFDEQGSRVFKSKNFRAYGEQVHFEKRDPVTGLYPITLRYGVGGVESMHEPSLRELRITFYPRGQIFSKGNYPHPQPFTFPN